MIGAGPRTSMRLLHVVPGLSPRFGGPSTAALEMVRELARQGLAVELATTDADVGGNVIPPPEWSAEDGAVPVSCFPSPTLQKYGYSPALNRWLRAHVQEFDLLHVHAFFSYATLCAARWARRRAVPYVLRPIGHLNPWPMAQNGLAKRVYLELLGRRDLEGAAAIHCTSEYEVEAVSRLGIAGRLVAIPLGLNGIVEEREPDGVGFRRRHGLPPDRALVVFLSRLHPKKGLDLLLPAARALADQGYEFVLALAGSGEKGYEAAVRDLVAANGVGDVVAFTGFLEGSEKYDLLREADVFVLPSYDENFGLAVVEAMSMGVPVVISERVGLHREVAAYDAGVVTPLDAREIARSLGRLLDDRELRRRLGENGKRLVRDRYQWSSVGRQLVELYESILYPESEAARR